MPTAFLPQSGPGPAGLLGLSCLACFALSWLAALVWAAKDVKRRDPARAPLWLALIIFTGPVGLLAWCFARPDDLVP